MIIQCDNCETRFRLDDSRIKSEGVRVRCTKCQNVFIVKPPPSADEVEVEDVFGMGAGEPDGDEAGEREGAAGKEEPGREAAPESPAGAAAAPPSPPEAEAGKSPFDEMDFSFTPEASGPGESAGPSEEEEPTGPPDTGDEAEPPAPPAGEAEGPRAGPDAGEAEEDRQAEGDLDAEGGQTFFFADGEEDEGEEAGKAEAPDLTTGFDADRAGGDEAEEPFTEDAGEAAPEPPSFEPPAEESTEEESVEEEAPGEEAGGDERKPFEDFDFGFDEAGGESSDSEESEGAEEEIRRDLSGGEPSLSPPDEDSAPGAEREAVEEPEEDDEGDFGLEEKLREMIERGVDDEGPSGDEPSGDEKVIPFSPGTSRARNGSRGGGGSAAGPEDTAEFSEVFSRELDDDEAEGEDAGDSPAVRAAADEPPARKSSRKGLMVALLIVVLGGVGLYASGVVDTVTRALVPPARQASEAVEIQRVEGYVVKNETIGNVFVVQSVLRNTTGEAQSLRGVRGVLYDSRGRALAEKTVAPGRMLSETDLRGMSREEIERYFSDSSGGTIPARGTIPVMVVFTELPPDVSEYGVDVLL